MQTLLNIKLPAQIENLERYRKVVLECAKEQGVAQERIIEIELAIEEALVNIFNYSYPEKTGDVEINCKVDHHQFIIEMIDSGIPFDMTSHPNPDLKSDLSERQIGGLGIYLIKRMMDEVRYRRENDQNILTLIVKRAKHES
jgi:serine/threonine-protein kinase RsbW